jgi:glycosyltransferase involved in cell wall biosynthesis
VQLAYDPALAKARFAMGMDTPWRGGWRQRMARFKLGGYLSRMHRVIVAGERAWQYARKLGVPEAKIRRGMYGFDAPPFAAVYGDRMSDPAAGWPRRFLYTGRYVDVKGVDVLMAAYQMYRRAVNDPWPLTCCGAGPLRIFVSGDGVDDAGFVQPADLPAMMRRHGAFVIASRYEPWGVVVAEAAATGLPILCSEAVGGSVELVRSHFNGLSVASGDVDALANGMKWFHGNADRLATMGQRSSQFAGAFAADVWADRWLEALT